MHEAVSPGIIPFAGFVRNDMVGAPFWGEIPRIVQSRLDAGSHNRRI
jgi:hypothetical protein